MIENPEIGSTLHVGEVATNYHDHGDGPPVLLIHGSGPGVSAWANWRTVLPALSQRFRVIAPDILGFGYTERPPGTVYGPQAWLDHLLGVLDGLGLERVSLVGNSFGGSLALSLATTAPERVDRLVLMGSVGVPFEITPGLDAVWGFEPSFEAMRSLLDVFTFDTSSVNDELARLRLDAATRPGVHEAYASMFPAPRQRMVDAMTIDQTAVAALPHQTLIVHGRDDQVIPPENSLKLLDLIDNSQLHMFSKCGHWVQIEQGERFVRLLTDFLAEDAG
ncbi:MAG: alpha/beta fold hydrolase [Actinomycetales bacterium]